MKDHRSDLQPVAASSHEAGSARAPAPGDAAGRSSPPNDLTSILGSNLHRLRVRRGLSLERLAQVSGVSRAMLSQIELGRSTPSINIVWRIATALDVPFSALAASREQRVISVLRRQEAKVLSSHDGAFTSRALFPFDEPRRVEFYELRVAPGAVEQAEPHAAGTTENLVVAEGCVALDVGGEQVSLSAGDAIVFRADRPHAYSNAGPTPAVLYLVMTYMETVG